MLELLHRSNMWFHNDPLGILVGFISDTVVLFWSFRCMLGRCATAREKRRHE